MRTGSRRRGLQRGPVEPVEVVVRAEWPQAGYAPDLRQEPEDGDRIQGRHVPAAKGRRAAATPLPGDRPEAPRRVAGPLLTSGHPPSDSCLVHVVHVTPRATD